MTMRALMINDASGTIYCRDAVSLQTYAICRGSRGSRGRGKGRRIRQANKKMNNTCQVLRCSCATMQSSGRGQLCRLLSAR